MLLKLLHKVSVTGIAFALAGSAYAEILVSQANIPTVSDPGRIERSLMGQPGPKFKPAPAVRETSSPPTKLGAKAAKIRFKLTRVLFQGNHLFSQTTLNYIFQPYLNKTISLPNLVALTEKVTKKYRDMGYILSRAFLPPQEIKQGVVHVQIVEGYISKVIIKGKNLNKTRFLLRAYSKKILASRPLQIHKLERYMLLANDTPGLNVQAILTPSKNIPGSADLTLVANQQRGTAYFIYNNYGTRYIGPNQETVGGSLYSLLSPGDNNSVRLSTTSRSRELQYAELVHSQPITANGVNWSMGGNYAQTKPGFVLQPLNIISRSAVLFTDFSYSLRRTRSDTVFLHSTLNYQNITSSLSALPFYADRIRSVIAGASYQGVDRWYGINNASLDMSQGFNILGANFHVNQSRPEGHSQFTKALMTLSRLQELNSRFSLYAALHTQYAWQALLATEQFGFGGPDYGRGYDPSEIVGDKGLAGKFEVRLNSPLQWRALQSIEYYAFYDAGVIWNIDNVDLPGKQSAMSTGLGARFNFIPQLSGEFFIAKPLTRQVATQVILGRNGNSARAFFQLAAHL